MLDLCGSLFATCAVTILNNCVKFDGSELLPATLVFADICSQVTGALLAQRYGGKVVLGSAGLAWSVLTCLTPLSASLGLVPLIACRVLLGVAEGFLIPVNSHIVASWVPAEERSRAVSAVIAGCNCGTVAAFLLSPLIMVSFGWPYCFYIFGSTGFVWYAVWQIFAEDAPQDAKSVSAREESVLSQAFESFTTARAVFETKSLIYPEGVLQVQEN